MNEPRRISMDGLMFYSSNEAPVMALEVTDPQAHIDALVEAGVLESGVLRGQGIPLTSGTKCWPEGDFIYRASRHEHQWRVDSVFFGGGAVRLACRGCPATPQVPNRLPIEAPE